MSGGPETSARQFPHLLVWGGVLVVGVLVGAMAFHALAPVEVDGEGLVRVDAVSHEHEQNHVHGIGYDQAGDRLYIATHFGLFLMTGASGEDSALYQVGGLRHDLMGFSLDPQDGDRMFASGHPEPGKNMGVARSTDGGFNWDEVWGGPDGRHVDLHVMALSPADPERLAGYEAMQNRLLLSLDAGKSWQIVDLPVQEGVAALAWDAQEPDTLWLGSVQGLYSNDDRGGSWTLEREGVHTSVYAHPGDARVWAWEHERGLLVRSDEGGDWNRAPDPLVDRDVPAFAMSGASGDGDVLFVALVDGQVMRTLDGGESWQRVHPLE